MFPRIPLSALLLRIPLRVGLAWLWLGTGLVHGEYRDDSGYNQLKAELGAAFPTGAGVGVSQTEAPADAAFSYLPDRTSTEFTGKIINASSGTAGVSGHASTVATLYYGSFSSMAPGVTSINVYEANSWITNFVGWNTTNEPAFEGQAVENHSWIGSLDNGGPKDVDALRRFDYVLQRGDVLAAVGVNNGSGNPVPSLLANAYNAISVGLPSGNHSTGTSSLDGLGRVKPIPYWSSIRPW